VKGVSGCCISNVVGETDDDVLWNSIKEVGNVRSGAKNMKALTMKMDSVTLSGAGRGHLTCFVY
jgi:hypothetical protein